MIRQLLLLCGLGLIGPTAAETTHCTVISALPYTITTQGLYCLTQDFSTASTTGNFITINTNNVTLDCNDRRLGGLAAGSATQARGIYADGRANVTVRNCQVRGFRIGISLAGSGHTVENNRLDGNTTVGISVSGEGSVVRGNRVLGTGGNTANDEPKGIYTADDVDIIDNTVAEVRATAGSDDRAYGIHTWHNYRGVIAHNRVRNVLSDTPGAAFGISNVGSQRVSLFANRISNPGTSGAALLCASSQGIATGNHLNGYATALDNCTNGGHNAVVLAP